MTHRDEITDWRDYYHPIADHLLKAWGMKNQPLTVEQRARLWMTLSRRFERIAILVDFQHRRVTVDGLSGDSRLASGEGETLEEALQTLRRRS